MNAVKKLEPYLEVVSILPGDRLRVTLPNGVHLHFQYDRDTKKWREYLAVPNAGLVTGEDRQDAWELLHNFFGVLSL